MALLNITKVSDAGERCWGVLLFGADDIPLLRSEKGVIKGEVASIAKALKFEGPGAPVEVEDNVGESNDPAWVIEKTDRGWVVRFTRVAATVFSLMLKPEDAAGPPKVAQEAVLAVKNLSVAGGNQVGSPGGRPRLRGQANRRDGDPGVARQRTAAIGRDDGKAGPVLQVDTGAGAGA